MKITFLALHLNYGGVEKAVIDQANLLSEKYKIKIISLYKIIDEPAFKLNSNVEVVYLLNEKPNRAEGLKAVKTFNIKGILFEGIKALKILYLKRKKMIDEIKKIDSGVIISSRISFTSLLSKYGSKNVLKIAEEHCHHNNKKSYISRLGRACKNIDYLLPVSKELTNFYSSEFKKEKVRYIPHFLDYLPEEKSKLDNYNIVTIGRLEKEKGFLDLIEVFKKLTVQDSRFSLTIIGGGSMYDQLQNKINDNKLQINLVGFKNQDFIRETLKNSSLYLMSSYEESFGLVLIEAMSFGVPCIAFDSAQGANEIIDDGVNGYLIKDRNKEEMVSKIIAYYKNDKNNLSNEALKTAQSFSKKNIANMWFELISGGKI